MLMPKRVKRRRVFRGRMKGKAHRGNFLAYGVPPQRMSNGNKWLQICSRCAPWWQFRW